MFINFMNNWNYFYRDKRWKGKYDQLEKIDHVCRLDKFYFETQKHNVWTRHPWEHGRFRWSIMSFSVTYNKVQQNNLKHIHVKTQTKKKSWPSKFKFFKRENPDPPLRQKGLKTSKDIFGRKMIIGRESEFEYSNTYCELLPRAPALKKQTTNSSIAQTVYRLTLPTPYRDPGTRRKIPASHKGRGKDDPNGVPGRDGLNLQNKTLTKLEMDMMVNRLSQPTHRERMNRDVRKHSLTIKIHGDAERNLASVSVWFAPASIWLAPVSVWHSTYIIVRRTRNRVHVVSRYLFVWRDDDWWFRESWLWLTMEYKPCISLNMELLWVSRICILYIFVFDVLFWENPYPWWISQNTICRLYWHCDISVSYSLYRCGSIIPI